MYMYMCIVSLHIHQFVVLLYIFTRADDHQVSGVEVTVSCNGVVHRAHQVRELGLFLRSLAC